MASLRLAYYFFNMLLFHSSNSKIFQPCFTRHMISHLKVFVFSLSFTHFRLLGIHLSLSCFRCWNRCQKLEKSVSRVWENAYLSIKNPKASRALKQALHPGCTLLTSLLWLHFATSATFGLRSWAPPLDQILDPHLTFIFSLRLENTFRILAHVDQFKRDIDTQCYLTKIFISLKTKYSVNK